MTATLADSTPARPSLTDQDQEYVMKYRSNTEITIEIIELMAKGDSKKTNIRFKAYLSFSYRPKKKTNYRKLFERALKYIDCNNRKLLDK